MMKRLLLMTLALLCSFAAFAEKDGEVTTQPRLVEIQNSRSLIIYPDVYVISGDLYVEVAQSAVQVRIYPEGESTPVVTTSNYGQVAVDLDNLQSGTYTLIIDANGRQFEATFVVFTIK